MRNETSRRKFLLCTGGSLVAAPLSAAAAAESTPWNDPANVRKVYLAVPKPTWPKPDLDVAAEIAGIEAELKKLERRHQSAVRFTGGEILRSTEDVPRWLESLDDADGVLVLDLTSSTGGMLNAMQGADTPMLLFTRPYAGWSYINFAEWRQKGKKADLVASSEFGDLDPYLPVFQTIRHLKKSKVLMVRPGAEKAAQSEFTKLYGTAIEPVSYEEVEAFYKRASEAKAREEAQAFTRAALRVVEPTSKDITEAMRFYLGVVDLLKERKANAITIDCLGGFRRGELPAYPCVAWSKLNDAGQYGVCEADLPSTMTQLLLTSYSKRPGFVSDPVFDTHREEIIHAHCVSATALNGVGGKGCPYAVRSHMEDNKGVSMQVLVPVGDTVTVAKFLTPKRLGISTGEVTGNIEHDRGCRTQFRTKVPNARRMLENYAGGLHRVVFYGDWTAAAEKMGRLMGFEVYREA
jgi:hypothetical protein